MTEAILAFDLGTSSIKALLIDRHGTIIARDRVPHTTTRPTPDSTEQDPNEWWANTRHIIARLSGQAPGSVTITAISVTGQMHGLVLHDRNDRPLRNAITWQDRRSATILPELLDRLSAGPQAQIDSSIAPGYQVASWHWLGHSAPELAPQVHRMLLPKDELVFRLTGRHVTDPSDAVGSGLFDGEAADWNTTIIDAAKVPRAALPEIVSAGDVVGTVLPGIGTELGLGSTVSVIIAGGDAAVAALGAGVVHADEALLMLSTGCQVLAPVNELSPARDNDAVYWPSANPAALSRWLRVGTTLNGGNAIDWARRVFANGDAGTYNSSGDLPSSDHRPPMFIPWLHGERVPNAAPTASGAFFGLSSHHEPNDMVQAVIDGVTLGIANAFERIGGDVGTDAPLRVGGGGVRNRLWLQSIARVFARPLDVIGEPDLSAWGAARSAASTLGWIDPLTDPHHWLPPIERIAPPRPDHETARSRLKSWRRIASAADVAREQPQ